MPYRQAFILYAEKYIVAKDKNKCEVCVGNMHCRRIQRQKVIEKQTTQKKMMFTNPANSDIL